MHEFSIVQGLIQQVEEQLQKENYRKVLTIEVEVGEMSGVVVDARGFGVGVCSEGTMADGAKLSVSMVRVTAECRQCHKEFNVEEYTFSCPECGAPDLEVLSGYELIFKEMEVE